MIRLCIVMRQPAVAGLLQSLANARFHRYAPASPFLPERYALQNACASGFLVARLFKNSAASSLHYFLAKASPDVRRGDNYYERNEDS